MASEKENYSNLQESKDRLRTALEDIKKYDCALGGDGDKRTFDGEVKDIIEEVFPDCLY